MVSRLSAILNGILQCGEIGSRSTFVGEGCV